jgi:arylsulfatase A-like enzyme
MNHVVITAKGIALLLLATPSVASAAGLTARFPLDDVSGPVVLEVIGGQHGTASNLTFGEPGVLNQACRFTETSPSSIHLGTSSAVQPAGAFTVTCWVKGSTNGFDDNERLLDCSNGDAFSAMSRGFNLKRQNGGVRVFFGDGAQKAFTAGPANAMLAANTWHLAAFRFQPSTAPGTSSDGAAAATAIALGTNAITATQIAARTDASAHAVGGLAYDRALQVGVPTAAGVSAALAFDGWMDDLRFHEGYLADSELAAIYNEIFGDPPPPPTFGALRWHWNVSGDFEGWTLQGMSNAIVTNGVLSAVSGGGNPQFISPDNLNVGLSHNTRVYLRLRNGSSLTQGAVHFQTVASPVYTGQPVTFNLVASDPQFTTYSVDLGGHPNWTGTLKRLRLDLPDGGSAGALMQLDWVAVGDAGRRPNVIFVLCDDLGWMDVSIHGSTFYRTPNVERLAARGMLFTQAYTANPLCSPTRASVLTGQYPGRLRFTTPAGHLSQVILDPVVPATAASTARLREPQSCTRLKNEYVTYAEVLKTNGYSTAFMGKWHLGSDPYLPENQGFDYTVGGRQHPGPPGGYFAPFAAGGNLPFVPAGTHVNDVLADSAVSFLEAHRHRPFLVNLWFYDVHSPWECKPDLRAGYLGRSSADGRQKNPTMGAMIETMDTGLGRVLDKLEQLGLEDNTIIVFFSDNGGVKYSFVDGALVTDNWPLRNGKASVYEGGTRVPCVVVWPGHVAPGSTNASLLSSVDFYPTLLEMLDLQAVPGTVLDGVSQVPALLGTGTPRTNVFVHFPHSTPAPATFAGSWVRSGD